MATIEPTSHTIDAINSLIRMVVASGVSHLAETYGFSKDEALSKLEEASLIAMPQSIEIPAPITRTRSQPRQGKTPENSPNIPLPWCGKEVPTWCHALRVNHNLFSQCTNPIEESEGNSKYCKTCWANYQSRGFHKYGDIDQRKSAQESAGNTVEYTYDNGKDKPKRALPYANVMAKQSPPITREQAEKEAARFGLTIPEEQFQYREMKRGRPSAQVTVTTIPLSKKTGRTIYSNRDHDMESQELTVEMPQKNNNSAGHATHYNNEENNDDRNNNNDESEVEVEEFTHQGTMYYLSTGEDAKLYNPETSEVIGRWDKTQQRIICN